MGSTNPTMPNPRPPPPPPSSSSFSPQGPPPCPASAARPFTSDSEDPPTSPQQFGSGGHNGDDPSSASGGTLPMMNEDGSRVPMEETNPESTYTPPSDTLETQEGEQAIVERAEKLNEPVQESRDGEGAEHEEEEERGVTTCTGSNREADATTE